MSVLDALTSVPSGAPEPEGTDVATPTGPEPEPRPDPSTAPPRPSLPYEPALDGLRGLAVLGVLFFHGGFSWAVGGYLGVSTFFTLSGFLITSLLVAEREANGGIALGRFWGRRFRRLMPAALAALILILAYGLFAATDSQLDTLRGDVLAALAYVANWRFIVQDLSYGDLFSSPSPVQHFWSLAIEEQFYVVFPLVTAGLLAAGRGSRRVLLVALGLGALASTVLMASLHTPGLDTTRVYYGTGTRAAELLVGAVLAVVATGTVWPTGPRYRLTVTVLAFAGLATTLWWWSTVDQASPWLYEGGLTIYSLLSVGLIVGAVTAGPFRQMMALEPLRRLGLISYGVYLYHWPIFLWINEERTGLSPWPLFAVRVTVTLVLAVASYHLLEQPIRRGRALTGPRRRLAAPVAVTGIALAAVIVVAVAPGGVDVGTILDRSPEAQSPADAATLLADRTTGEPAVNPQVERVLFVGDSVMGQAYPAFEAAFAREGIVTAYAGGPGTGPLAPQGDWLAQTDEWIERFEPDAVVLEACCDYSQAPDQLYIDNDGTEVLPNTERTYEVWAREAAELAERASAGGGRVFWTLAPPVETNGFYGPLEEHVDRTNAIYRDLGVDLVDWITPLAPDGEFAWQAPGPGGDGLVKVRLDDGVHLTEPGSRLVAGVTLEAILALEEQPTF